MEKQAGNRLMDTVGEGEGRTNQAVALMDLSWSHPPQGKEPKSPFPTCWKGTWQRLQRMGPEPTGNLSLAGLRQVEHTGLPRRRQTDGWGGERGAGGPGVHLEGMKDMKKLSKPFLSQVVLKLPSHWWFLLNLKRNHTCNSMADSCQCMTKPTEML